MASYITKPPPGETILLNRIAFGPRPEDIDRVRNMGVSRYIEEQLDPNDNDDPLFLAKLKSARLGIQYEIEEKQGDKVTKKTIKEDRGYDLLNKPVKELWKLAKYDKTPQYEERVRPFREARAAAWLRAVYSKWQLREVLVDFWHNHFNVNATSDDAIAATFPVYDRDVIRKNCLGNFRFFLEDVARSTAMQYYLNNVSSKASPANENYARELFELHTLGAKNYFNEIYKNWREVPGALKGKPTGFIDQDVYEAARAFTGWSIANANEAKGTKFPDTGEFFYAEGWHDNYQKRVLGVEFDPNTPPLADGRKVLDLVSKHEATAEHLCFKLCRRLVADDPPPGLVEKAARLWISSADKPDQIKRVVRFIITSPEFISSFGKKTKRPFEVAVSFLRSIDADFQPNVALDYYLYQMGQRIFEWQTPTGHPDTADHWTSPNVMLWRWHLVTGIIYDGNIGVKYKFAENQPANIKTPRQITEFWSNRILGRIPSDETLEILRKGILPDNDFDKALEVSPKDMEEILKNLARLIASTPDFQIR